MTPIFINTRPEHRAHNLATLADVRVLHLPLLEIRDIPLDVTQREYMNAWQHGDYAALVVTSVESAKRALSHLNLSIQPPTTPIIAVGQATAGCLTSSGFSVQLPHTANNEGMLQLPEIQRLTKGQKVLIWRGVGGRRLLHDNLVARGVQVDAIAWYERCTPKTLAHDFQQLHSQLDTNTPIFVLISSQMALENWLKLTHSSSYHYLALGERLQQLLTARQLTSSQIEDLSPTSIRQAIFSTHLTD